MKIIDHFIEEIHEELEGAKHYAEKYIEWKARGDSNRYNRYKEFANDELKHAAFVHDLAITDIDSIKRIYTLSDEDEEKWTHAHKHYAECVAIIRQMLM
jgi:hypothetical protein